MLIGFIIGLCSSFVLYLLFAKTCSPPFTTSAPCTPASSAFDARSLDFDAIDLNLKGVINQLWQEEGFTSGDNSLIPLKIYLEDLGKPFQNLFSKYEKVVHAITPNCEDVATFLACLKGPAGAKLAELDDIVGETCRGYNQFKNKTPGSSEEYLVTKMVDQVFSQFGFLSEDLVELIFAVHDYLCDQNETLTGEQLLMDLKYFLCGDRVLEAYDEVKCNAMGERVSILPFEDGETYNKYQRAPLTATTK